MLLGTLKQNIAHLGFAKDLEEVDSEISEDVFFSSLNKAVYTLNGIRPRMSVYSFFPRNLGIAECFDTKVHKGSDLVISVPFCVSYTFLAHGKGHFSIKADGNETPIVEKDFSAGERLCDYIGKRNDVVVTFSGDFLYTISEFALYTEAVSDRAEDIPAYREWQEYDLKNCVDDFQSLQGFKIEGNGKELIDGKDYRISSDGKIFLPRTSFDGTEYRLTYQRTLRQYSEDDDDHTEIDLDEDIAQLLVNLVAFYVLLDDEPQKAAQYFNIYQAEKAEIMAKERKLSVPAIRRMCDWGN